MRFGPYEKGVSLMSEVWGVLLVLLQKEVSQVGILDGGMSIAGFAQVSFRIRFRAVLLTPYHKGNNSYF